MESKSLRNGPGAKKGGEEESKMQIYHKYVLRDCHVAGLTFLVYNDATGH